MKKHFILLSLLTCLLTHSAHSQLYFPPVSGTWDTLSANTLNWCPDKIQVLYDYLDSTNSKAFIVLKDGKIVLEKYFDSFTQDSLHVWNSAGKTLVGLMTGIAQEEGFLSIGDTTSTYLGTGWTSLTPAQEEKITIRHQLSMTTGMDDATNGDCTDPGCLTYLADAGTRWSYHNAPYTLLNTVVSNAVGQNFNAYVASKLGNSTVGINGLFVNFGYNKVFISNPRSFARFGLLLLANGDWNSTPILNDPTFFSEMINPSQTINPSYGYLTWLNGQSSYMLPTSQFSFSGSALQNAPLDMYAALGKNGQIINVVPSQNLVMIRMGDGDGFSFVGTQYNDSIWIRMNDLECTSSLDEFDNGLGLSIFPNPSNGAFQVKGVLEQDEIYIHDYMGRFISYDRTHSEIFIKTSGLYFVKVKRGDHISTHKILIE